MQAAVENSFNDVLNDFNEFFVELLTTIIKMNLKNDDVNTIMDLMRKLIEQNCVLQVNLIKFSNASSSKDKVHQINSAKDYVTKKITEFDSTYKRNKFVRRSKSYVKPISKAIGVRWDPNLRKNIQCTFQYVPIIETLKSLFSQQEFRNLYFTYNNTRKESNEFYESFCDGEVFKKNAVLVSEPSTMQIQLYTDDVELCNPLQMHAGLHKTRLVFMQLKNLPPQYLSRIENIYLVAICNTNDVRESGFQHVLELIVKELAILERDGIDTGDCFLKGILTSFVFDNLGGNECFGFTKCFSKGNFCRICKIDKPSSETLTTENPSLLRTKEEYENFILKGVNNLIPKENAGYTQYCILNDLTHFHILSNVSVDIMHDVMEGTISILLYNLFQYCITHKFIKEDLLQKKITSFDYGCLNRRNNPYEINLKKTNLGLSASKTYCLMIFVPFILSDLKSQLSDVWICVSTMLQIMQIIFSRRIEGIQISRLQSMIDLHLRSMRKFLVDTLTPKQHILTHYPRAIQLMGPIIYLTTIRYESKNGLYANLAKRTKNFKNINFSLAHKTQELAAIAGFTYKDKISTGTPKSLDIHIKRKNNNGIYEKYRNIYEAQFENTSDLELVTFFYFNGVYYKQGLVILKNNMFYKIVEIVKKKNEYWFLSEQYKVKKFDTFFNSINVERCTETSPVLIYFKDLDVNNSYEIIVSQKEQYIPAETIELLLSTIHA